jgi:hypothetical protein
MENETQPGGIISPSQPPAGQPPVPPTEPQPATPLTPAAPLTTETPAPGAAPVPAQPLPAFMNPPGTPGATSAPIQSASMQSKGMKNRLKLPLIIVAALLILGGGSAAAYFGVVVPNKPENKILSAFANLASQKNVTMDGSVNYSGSSSVNVDYKLALNSEKTQVGLSGSVGFKGAKIPYELRFLDKDLYFKVSGISSLASLAPSDSYGLDYGSLIKKIDDQWFVVDSSFVDNLGLKSSCIDDFSFALNNADVALLKKAYKEHPLFLVKSSSSESVDGVATTKYIVDPTSDTEAAAFASGLKELSLYKKAQSCAGNSVDDAVKDTAKSTSKDDAKGTFAIYVTKNKQLKKIEITSTESDNNFKMGATFSYAAVNIAKPDGAKPAQELYASVLGGLGFGGISDLSGATTSTNAADTERQNDITRIAVSLEEYGADNNGVYPSFADMNNSSFISSKMPSLDKEALKDPSGTSYALSATPQKGLYSYVVTPSGCDNSSQSKKCLSYVLTATLSDGTTYTQ